PLIFTLSLHDALPISLVSTASFVAICTDGVSCTDSLYSCRSGRGDTMKRFKMRLAGLALLILAGVADAQGPGCPPGCKVVWIDQDRKSTRLNSSHDQI